MPAVWPNYYRTIHAFEENDTQTEILSYNDPLLDKQIAIINGSIVILDQKLHGMQAIQAKALR